MKERKKGRKERKKEERNHWKKEKIICISK